MIHTDEGELISTANLTYINSGYFGDVFKLGTDKCLKLFKLDVKEELLNACLKNEEIIKLIKSLNFDSLTKIYNLLYKDDKYIGYIMKYYKGDNRSVLDKDISYLINSFKKIENDINILNGYNIILRDFDLKNVIKLQDKIVLCDFDLYEKSNDYNFYVQSKNRRLLVNFFRSLIFYELSEFYNIESEDIKYYLCSTGIEDVFVDLSRYKKPIEFFRR